MKRLLSFLLAILLMMSLLPVSAMAATTAPDSHHLREVNPAYAYLLKEEDLRTPTYANAKPTYASTYYTTATSAGAAVRKQMEARAYGFTIGYRFTPSEWSTQEGFSNAVRSILNAAWSHTGVPTQGDYLRFQLGGWSIDGYRDYIEGSYYYCTLTFYLDYFTTAYQESVMDSRVNSLLAQLNPTGSDYQKIKTVYDWMCSNITYDYENVNDPNHLLCHSAYAALIDKTAVCQGYTMLLYRLALELGIDSRAIPSIYEENHIWNIIKMGSQYYNTDSTWDAGYPADQYEWFLRGSSDFPYHTRDAEFSTSSFNSKYPTAYSKYNPSEPPTITKQPQNVAVPNGQTATVTIEATSPLGVSYQWYYKNAGASSFTRVEKLSSGDNSNTYSVTMSDSVNGRQVYCEVSNLCGSTKSNVVTLSKATPLTITQQPQSVTVPNGMTAKVTVKASGDGLTYQWYYKNASASSFSKSSNTTSTYSATMSNTVAGRQVYCKITDKYGNSVKTNTVTLKQGATLTITTQPKSVTVPNGMTAKFTVKASGDGLTYQWYYKNADASSFVKSPQTTNTYSIAMSNDRAGRQVYCKITDKYGKTVKTNTVTMKQGATLTITSQPKSVTVPNGMTAKVTVKASGDGLTYQWYYKNPGSSTAVKTVQTTNTYSLTMTNDRAGRQVYCKITDKYGKTVTTNTVTLKQGATLTITSQPKSVTVPNGMTAKVTVKASGDGLSYQWYYKNPGSSTAVKTVQTTSTYSLTMTNDRAGRQVYCKITDKYGKTVTTNTVTLKQGATLTITTQPKTVTVPNGMTAKFTVKASGDGLTYQWYYKNAGASSFVKSPQTTSTYSIAMSNDRAGRQLYCKITDKYGKTVTTNIVTMKQGATLTITTQPKSVTVANGATATFTVKASGDGLTYQWYYKNAGASSFVKSPQTTSTYSIAMSNDRAGRQLYCKITDKYGKTVTTNIVTMNKR